MRTFSSCILVAVLQASSAFAQSSSGTWSDLPDRFQIDTGYFRIDATTVLRLGGPGGSNEVDFEQDLGVPGEADTLLGGRHLAAWVGATSSS